MKRNAFILMLFAITLIAACSKKSNPAKTVEAPKVIPTTYTVDITPLIQAKCAPCHLPSKGGNKANFENYEGAKKYGADMLTRVSLEPGQRGFMPFKHAKLPAEEIAVIKKWVDQGLLEK